LRTEQLEAMLAELVEWLAAKAAEFNARLSSE
jgi:hypothetical protein